MKLVHAGWILGGFELFGVVGMLLSGWLTDKFFGGRGGRMCLICMFLAGLSVFAFWKIADYQPFLSTAALFCGAFFIYAPRALVGITVANLATKRAAATAIGLTGLFGYLSTVVFGLGLGGLVQKTSWNAGFFGLVSAPALGTILFAAVWNAKADGYDRE